jgi:hypothetical protein
VCAAPFVVPVLYLAWVFHLQADDYLGARQGADWAHQRYFDDYDMTAFALRGLNATLGRSAGRTDLPKDISWKEYNRALREDRPLRPRYHSEYPHAAMFLFRLGYLGQPLPPVPAALLDGSYGNIYGHWPDGDAEEDLWRRFRRAIRVYECLMVLCFFGLVLTLRAGYDRAGTLASNGLLLLMPASLFFTVNRFDVVPTLLTALSLACLGRRWVVASACFLAAGAMLKVFPALLAPLVLRYLLPEWRAAARWLTAFTATAAALLLGPLLREGWQAVWAPYQFQLNREPFGWTAYGYILPPQLAENFWWAKAFRLSALLAALVALLVRPVPDLGSLLRRGAIMLIVFVTLPVFYSPQWVLWLMPLLLPLARRRPRLVGLVVALDLVTYLNWPFLGCTGDNWRPWIDLLVLARFGTLAALAVLLLRDDRQALPAAKAPAPA